MAPTSIHSSGNSGQVVLAKGSSWPALLFVRMGHLLVQRTLRKDDLPPVRLGPGECFPDLSLLEGGFAAHYLVAEDRLEIASVEARDLELLLATHPNLALRLFRGLAATLCRHLRLTVELLHELTLSIVDPSPPPSHPEPWE